MEGGSESEKDADDEISGGDGDDYSISSAQEFELEYGTVTLKPSLDTTQDSNSIWVMESQAIVKAGTLQWRSGKQNASFASCQHLIFFPTLLSADVVFFRHFNTGKYLCSYDPSKFILGQDIAGN